MIPFKYYKLIVFCFFLFPIIVSAQSDSAVFVNAQWKKTKIARGVMLLSYHFNQQNLFGAPQHVSYVIAKNKKFYVAAEEKILKATSNFATENNALVAINGNFFDMKNGGSVDLTKANGIVVNTNRFGSNAVPAFHQKAAVVANNGRLSIVKGSDDIQWTDVLTQSDIMLNGPLLIYNNIDEKLDSNAFNANRHPRTAVATTKKGRVIMLVMDGRSAHAAGVSLFELTKVMRWLGAKNAINFDGGGSSALWIKGSGIVNYPSDNKTWDHAGERKVANILYIKNMK